MDPRKLVQIGDSDVAVTRLGFGGAPVGGEHTDVDARTADQTIKFAYERGIRYFDTAPYYGHGKSEVRIGQALKQMPRGGFQISTKVGRALRPCDPNNIQNFGFVDPLPFVPEFDFSEGAIVRSFEESLERLQLGKIDIVLIHDPDDHYEQALKVVLPTLQRLKAQGLIGAIGAGMNQAEMLARFAREAQFDCFLLAGRYTLLDQIALAELLPLCEQRNISIILGGPFNSGILAGKVTDGARYNYVPASKQILERALALEKLCDRWGVPLKAAALQFPFGHNSLVSVIPGVRSAAEVSENIEMMEFEISEDFWQALSKSGLIAADAPLPIRD